MKYYIVLLILFLSTLKTLSQAPTTYGTNAGTAGGGSSYYGYEAGMNSNMSSGANTFIGAYSGTLNTSGSSNTFVGNHTGYNNTASYNSFFGSTSGQNNTSGHSNSFFGYNSGMNNTTGYWNSFYGRDAGRSVTGGAGNSIFGFNAGKSLTGGNGNCFFGTQAGEYSNSGTANIFIGYLAGNQNTSGNDNLAVGSQAGYNNITGYYNTFIGMAAGHKNNDGFYNCYIGGAAGQRNIGGNSNSFIGVRSGSFATSGQKNTYLGFESGMLNTSGSNNVFLGYRAGYGQVANNTLYIHNDSSSIPLVYGEFSSRKLGINTKSIPNGYTMGVKGKIITEEVKVQLTSGGIWPDYVFDPEYKLPTLKEIEAHIKENGHLPEVPSAADIKQNEGYELGSMDMVLLKKIEELTLYSIEMEKQIKALQEENKTLKEDVLHRLDNLEKQVKQL